MSQLTQWLLREKISVLWISSPLFRNFTGSLTGQEKFPHVRIIRLTSEAVYTADVDIYKRHFSPNCVLANGLSSTETGLLATCLIDHKTDISGNAVPVGYPVYGKEILLLDDHGKEVGVEEVGEIAVRSRYLSKGYWRKPDLTRARFKPDPQGSEETFYSTGDLGIRLSDGCLVYKGRKDFRAKVRGYGVECEEVEIALLGHGAVTEAVVMPRQDESNETTRLVAYFVSSSQPGPSISELRRFIGEKLPDYMLPSVFVKLDSLPLTPNGKVNRKALPAPDNSRPELDTPYVAPRTPIEEDLAKIWAELLALDRVGIHDNFFELGGHSLMATQVISRVINTFKIELPINPFLSRLRWRTWL